MAENRVDPTVAGLFLVGFITLVFGLIGILLYGKVDGAGALAGTVSGEGGSLAVIVGVVFIVFTVSAIRCGNAFAAALFGFVAVALFGATVGLNAGSMYLFVVFAIVFILFALVAFLIGAPKLLAILLFFVALLYLFVGLWVNAIADDGMNNVFGVLFGLFGILAAAVALYMAFALSTQKLPVF